MESFNKAAVTLVYFKFRLGPLQFHTISHSLSRLLLLCSTSNALRRCGKYPSRRLSNSISNLLNNLCVKCCVPTCATQFKSTGLLLSSIDLFKEINFASKKLAHLSQPGSSLRNTSEQYYGFDSHKLFQPGRLRTFRFVRPYLHLVARQPVFYDSDVRKSLLFASLSYL